MAVSPFVLRALYVACLLVLVPTGCGNAGSTVETAGTPSGSSTAEPPDKHNRDPITSPSEDEPHGRKLDRPPPVTVRYGDSSLALHAYTYCYGNVCADGFPPSDPPSVGSPDHVLIDFPLDGWSFHATFQPTGQRCGRMQTVPLHRTVQGSFVLRPAGHAGTYDVTLFGRGNSDLVTVFRWSTPSDGPLPVPKSRLALIAGHDPQLDSYGVELEVSNLAKTPKEAAAKITATAANGESITFEATRSRQRCQPEGTVYWDGPDDQGLAAARLGQHPFTYTVVLTLDGKRHVATAGWPADVIRANEPSVRLNFTPALPALE
jgi:hypothetical protein